MNAKLDFLRTMLENSDLLAADNQNTEMAQEAWMDKEEESGLSPKELHDAWIDNLPLRVRDGANLIDLYMELVGLQHYKNLSEGAMNYWKGQFWKAVEKALKNKKPK